MNNYRQLVDELSCRHTLCDAYMRKLIINADRYLLRYGRTDKEKDKCADMKEMLPAG